jgi:hypothetical protein
MNEYTLATLAVVGGCSVARPCQRFFYIYSFLIHTYSLPSTTSTSTSILITMSYADAAKENRKLSITAHH